MHLSALWIQKQIDLLKTAILYTLTKSTLLVMKSKSGYKYNGGEVMFELGTATLIATLIATLMH